MPLRRRLLTAACFLLALTFARNATADTLRGWARAVDGDTLRIGRTTIRLHGIDAPEMRQHCPAGAGEAAAIWPCGRAAARLMADMLRGAPTSCAARGRDRYRRVVAVCRVEGRDVGAAMVEAGLAIAFRRYSLDYVAAEAEARAAGRGMWRGGFTAPSDWRRARRAGGRPRPARRIDFEGD